jgi:hypothetical protein
MLGTGAGFIALGWLAFDPNLLAPGAVVAADMALSCFMFAAVCPFYRYLKRRPGRLAGGGPGRGTGPSAKRTAILVFRCSRGWRSTNSSCRERPAERPDLAALPGKAGSLRLAGALLVVSAIFRAILWGFLRVSVPSTRSWATFARS